MLKSDYELTPMSDRPEPSLQDLKCPVCGETMQAWPALSGLGYVGTCPNCSEEKMIGTPAEDDPVEKGLTSGPSDPAHHFKELLAEAEASPKDAPLPESLIEDLPDEAKKLLKNRTQGAPQSPPEELSEKYAESLRDQGYVISQDAHGVRISGDLISRGSSSGGMTPHDIVRFAADLEGGLLPPEKTTRCPHCDAVVPAGEDSCQWCGKTLDSGSPSKDR